MKITNPMKWGFDPRVKGLHPIFESEKGRIIWGSIKSCHIADQYFNDNCYKILKIITNKNPKDAQELFSYANICGLGCFGKIINNTNNAFGYILTKPDMEFWGEMFDALTGKLKIKMEYPYVVNKE